MEDLKHTLNTEELGPRINLLDGMLMALLKRRMDLAIEVGTDKILKGKPFVRADAEDDRTAAVRTWAKANGLNEHYVETMLYSAINESVKVQTILRDNVDRGIVKLKDPHTNVEVHEVLKENLIDLTRLWSKTYDSAYDKDAFATRTYLEYERGFIHSEVAKLTHRGGTALDLGCATGRVALQLYGPFDEIVGYDLSPEMIAVAESKLDHSYDHRTSFKHSDLEDGIPERDSSASFVVMNLGTASDIRNIAHVIEEVGRVLVPGGRFVFSFYNADALVYCWDFIPWPLGLTARIDTRKHLLEVPFEKQTFRIYARPYSPNEVRALFDTKEMFGVTQIVSYPTISSILPNGLFNNEPAVQGVVTALDTALATEGKGAYVIVAGYKK